MAYSHKNGDARSCGATTIVNGNTFVTIDGQLWAVSGDPDSHGDGGLIPSQSFVTIGGIPVILAGDPAAPDDLCPIVGGPHCSPSAVGFDSLVNVTGG